ncbi:MAG TPA: DASS family sodium-coupled anion symporter [Pantanalinema sp.]
MAGILVNARGILGWMGRLSILPVLALLLWGPAPGGMTPGMRAVAALSVTMAILWVGAQVPLAATALLPIVLLPALGILSPAEAAGAYANDMVFLFIGGFVLANGIERWGLHGRLALGILGWLGTSQRRLVAGLMAATAFLSMWVSNTAAALLMMPIGLSVLKLAPSEAGAFRAAMVLGISTAATVGGMGTPIGSTPNLLLISTAQRLYQVSIDFGAWMMMGVPLVIVFTAIAWVLLTVFLFPLRGDRLSVGREAIVAQRRELGPVRREEWFVGAVFLLTALGWIFRESRTFWGVTVGLDRWLPGIGDGTVAMAGALALFMVPLALRPVRFALDWETGGKIPWDIILLFGGGMCLADGIRATGLDALLIKGVGGMGDVPGLALVVLVCAVCVLLSEFASNTATAALLLPLAGPLAVSLGEGPLYLMLPVALATSLGFMLPAATPPNALALATGHVTVPQITKAGAWLNLIGLVLVLVACFGIAFPLMGVKPGGL